MLADTSALLDFNLPNATTWFYFSFLLAVALFFKFSRILTVRNWDVVFLFLLTPGLLLLHGGRTDVAQSAIKIATLVGQEANGFHNGLGNQLAPALKISHDGGILSATPWIWIGYLWLMVGSTYFFIRCLVDLALVQRPALEPNLNFGGLAWLAAALFICLLAVAFRQPDRSQGIISPIGEGIQSTNSPVGREGAWLALARESLAPKSSSATEQVNWITRSFAGLCHLAVIVGLVVVGQRHFHDAHLGMAAATFYLLLPYTGLYVSQVHHVWPMALIIWALVVYRHPTISGSVLGLAAGTAYFPALTFPLWLSFYWKRGSGRFLVAFFVTAALCLAALGSALALQGELHGILQDVREQNAWQPWKTPTTEGFWTGVHAAYRIPVFLAYLAFVLATACWPTPKNLAHVISLSAAVIIGIQLWYGDQGGAYVLWYLPLLLLMVFRPNLSDRRPNPIDPERDWLARSGRAVRRAGSRALRGLVRAGQDERSPATPR